MIAFVGGQIYTMAEDGTGLRCLTDAFPPRETVFFDPIWSPDGRSLAFTLKEHILSPHSRACTITMDDKEVHYLILNIIHPQSLQVRTLAKVEIDPESGDPPSCPEWSPDSRSLLYTTFADPYVHIYRADIATGQTELLVGEEEAFRSVSGTSWS